MPPLFLLPAPWPPTLERRNGRYGAHTQGGDGERPTQEMWATQEGRGSTLRGGGEGGAEGIREEKESALPSSLPTSGGRE